MIKSSRTRLVTTILTVLILTASFTPPLSAATLNSVSSYKFFPNRYYLQTDTKALLTIYSDNVGLHQTTVVWKDPQGATVSCGVICATTYTYAPNGVVTSMTTEFFISEQGRPLGMYTAVISYCSNWAGTCYAWAEWRVTFYIAPPPQAPVVAMVPVGNYAEGIGVNPTTNRIYVANGSSNNVSVIDGASNTVVATATVGSWPTGVGVNPTTNRVYVTNQNDDSVSVIDGASNSVVTTVTVGSGPNAVGVNPTTNRIYVANFYGDTVSVIDGANNTVVATVTLGDYGPCAIGVNPAINRIYVVNEYSANVSVIDGTSNTVVATVTVGAWPQGVGINPTTNRIYVANPDDATVSLIDGVSNTVVATVTVGTNPNAVGVNPTTNHVFVANGNTVSVIDGASNIVFATVPLGRPARDAGVNPTTNRIYVANGDGNTVTVIQDEAAPDPSGYASAPIVGSTIDVGRVEVGSSATATLTISETGHATLNVTSYSLSGSNATDFSVSPETLSILDGGVAQPLSIHCTPGGLGLRTASLIVNHNAAGSPATYTLNCTGQTTVYLPVVLRTAP